MTGVNGKMDSLEGRLSSLYPPTPPTTHSAKKIEGDRGNPIGHGDEPVDQMNRESNGRPLTHDQVDGAYVHQVRPENEN